MKKSYYFNWFSIQILILLLISYTSSGQGFYFESMRSDFKHLALKSTLMNEDSLFQTVLGELESKDLFKEGGWPSERIVGGQDANIEDYPWHVALLSISGSQICGGTILSENWVLTAAHCGTPNRIRAGVTNRTDNTGQDRFVDFKTNHPGYIGSPFYINDIALVKLSSPLDFSDPKVKPIPIITQAHANDGYTDGGVMSVITGWGRLTWNGLTSDILQVAELPLVSNEDAYSIGWYQQSRITDDMIAAGVLPDGGTDACQGDSGGPLVVPDPGSPLGYSVAGVTSWGTGCAFPNYPGVWSRVSHNEAWISTVTGLSWSGPSSPLNPTDFEAVPLGPGSILLTWEKNGNNDEVLLLASESQNIGLPVNGEIYVAGDPIPGGGTVIYSGSNDFFEHTGLQAGSRKYYKLFCRTSTGSYSIGRAISSVTECMVFSSLPFIETFEENSLSLNCWSQLREEGPRFWSFGKGAAFGSINSAYNGDRNARFSSSPAPVKTTKLVSPVLNLAHYEDVRLSFWYGQEAWGGDQNILKIFYRTGPLEPWIQIGSNYDGSISSWTQVQDIELPNPSPRYQLAFEATDNYGYANVLDDVQVTGTWIGPHSVLSLQNVLLEDGDEECFAATEHVYIAGGGTTFIVEAGSISNITAGNSIHFFDGAQVKSGGFLHAYIDLFGDYCINHPTLLTIKDLFSDANSGEPGSENELFLNTPTLSVYPNPSSGLVKLEVAGVTLSSNFFIEIYSMMGELVFSTSVSGSFPYELNMSHLQKGMYLLRINDLHEQFKAKVLLH